MTKEAMKYDEAIELISKVLDAVRATRVEHEMITQALDTIRKGKDNGSKE